MKYLIIVGFCLALVACGSYYISLDPEKWACTNNITVNAKVQMYAGRSYIGDRDIVKTECVQYTRADYINRK